MTSSRLHFVRMRRIHALALVPVFALAACTTATAPATTAAPATSAPATSAPATSTPVDAGATLSGDGYTLTLPKGWEDATAAFKKLQAQVDTGAKETADTKDKFNDNVNVVVQTSAEVPFESLKTALKTQLEQAGSTNIEFKDNATLDGKDALHVWSITKDAGDAHTIQFMAFNGGKLYVLTVSTNRDDAAAATLSQQIVSGWKWTTA